MRSLFAVLAVVACVNAEIPVWYPDGECGQSKYEDAGEYDLPGAMIVGGIDARPHEFPWQISLWMTPTGSHSCGGEIIHPLWVMTAAHCVEGRDPSNLRVVIGEHDRSDDENENREVRDVELFFVHEQYGELTSYDADIALMKLTEPIEFNEDIQPVCAPETENNYDHYFSQISGWGSLMSGGPCCPNILMYTTVNITTNQYCDDIYSSYDITDNMICSSDNGDHTDRDSCQGDSGGPMTVKDSDGTFRVIGIVSWGIGCASGYPGVYTRVTPFNQWVLDKIEKN
ncbi:hypothetical protein CAPTEDRAFT_153798 [Capitella teleta]|uniref:Peptidase S1 domain-containing protein n=1 Tax=Capitella teleta TaxID=283909 RepID=R7UBH3_CAPTE|nr:hypothetical protein CAPTEDRAFT_153798 [Capitella teleta]|eukprot:ELU03725.1 hypothetical protein CAPTEDRAFT_153798 [Capitella teleta]